MMPKGFVLLHRNHDDKPHRVAVQAIARYIAVEPHHVRGYGQTPKGPATHVGLMTIDEGAHESLYVRETPEEIDRLIAAAQGEEVLA